MTDHAGTRVSILAAIALLGTAYACSQDGGAGSPVQSGPVGGCNYNCSPVEYQPPPKCTAPYVLNQNAGSCYQPGIFCPCLDGGVFCPYTPDADCPALSYPVTADAQADSIIPDAASAQDAMSDATTDAVGQ
jgi:hypothetical protein